MLIGFDASRAFVAEATGTENYSRSLLRALAKIDRKNQYRVYLREVETGPVSRFPPASAPQPFLSEIKSSNRDTKSQKGWVRAVGNPSSTATRFNWPRNFEFRLIRPSRLWTQLGLALETWRNPVDLLFIPAHTLPILRKRNFGILNFQFSIFNSLRRQTKYVVTLHDLGVEFLPGYHQFPQRYYLDLASRYAARAADAIIAVSAATRRDLINRYGVGGTKVFVVHEGVDRTFFKRQSKSRVESVRKKYKISGDYVLFVGTIQPRKNLQMLIEVFGDLVHSAQWRVHSGMSLILAGKLGWDYDEILVLPKKLGIGSRVKFLGHVPDADLLALYSGAVVLAFPSLFEGFGLPILEALSCGCAVVASDIAPHREILQKLLTNHYSLITNSVPMTLVKPKNVMEWVNVLYQYITQYEKRSTSSMHKSLSLDLFSWERTANATLQVFGKTLS